MGQKVHPLGLRLGINQTCDSRWFFAKKQFPHFLHQDLLIRRYLFEKLSAAGIAKIIIERPNKKPSITLHVSRPGIVIGKKGADIGSLRAGLMKNIQEDVTINIVEIRRPELDARLGAEFIAQQLERRAPFRRAMKKFMQNALKNGALGVRVNCAGRLGGAEIARTEWYREGRVPLHTLRADIDFGQAVAHTSYGTCGIKVWIYRGDFLEHDPMALDKKLADNLLTRS